MTKKISQLTPSVSSELNDASLLEVAIKDSNAPSTTGFRSASTSIGELRKVLNASSLERRVDINVDTTVNMSTNNQNIQIAVSKAFIPWDEAITDKFISVLLARFNVSGSAESSSLTLPLFSDMSVAYYASSTAKRVKYKSGYYMHSSQENGIHLAGVEPIIDISDDSISLYVSNVAETEDNIIFTVRLLKNYRPSVNPSDNYIVFTGPVRVKFRGYVDISASYEDKPSYLRLTSVPDGSISIQGFPVGSEINWGDGNTTAVSDSSQIYTHYYDSGAYVAEVILYNDISEGNDPLVVSGNFDKIINWGSFYYNRPITFTSPDLVEVPTTEPPLSNYSSLFRDCTNFNQNINTWNTSTVVNMSNTFYGCVNFNQPLDNWDVSNVSNFTGMFAGCSNFDQNINTWNTSMAVEMANMFSGCTSFNQHLNNWDMSNVTTVAFMLAGCTSFNKPLDNWVLSNVTNVSGMFMDAQTFNSNISGWNMENVTLMSYMFNGAASFNGDISNWDVSNVINMDNMFHNASMFNQDISNWCVFNIGIEPYQFSVGSPLTSEHKPVWGDCPEDGAFKFYYINDGAVPAAITGFPVGTIVEWPNGNTNTFNNVSDLFTNPPSTEGVVKVFINNSMPYGELNGIGGTGVTKLLSWGNYQGSKLETNGESFGLIGFDSKLVNVPSNLPPSITDLSDFFIGAELFNDPNVIQWDVSNVTNMSGLFNGASIFDQDISGWDVSNVTNMNNMFNNAQSFNQDLSNWCVINILSEPVQFSTNSPLLANYKPQWGTCPTANSMKFTTGLGEVHINGFPSDCVVNWGDGSPSEQFTILGGAYHNYLSAGPHQVKIYIPEPDSESFFFYSASITGDALLSLDDWGDYYHERLMLENCPNLSEVPVNLPSTITDTDYMFRNCTSLNSWNVRYWDVSNVTTMHGMFSGATQFNSSVGNWDVSNVTNMGTMFYHAQSFNQDISGWDVSNVTDMGFMFNNAQSFNQDISGWDVSNVTNMSGLFTAASIFDQDISGWDVSNVTVMGAMFHNAQSFNQDISGWDVSNVTDMGFMFNNAQSFNQDISGWDVSNVTNMAYMFDSAQSFDQDISGWDVSNVEYMDAMFNNAQSFNQDLSNWCVFNIPSEPFQFSTNSPLLPNYKPQWGDCPSLGLMSFDIQEYGGYVEFNNFPVGSVVKWGDGSANSSVTSSVSSLSHTYDDLEKYTCEIYIPEDSVYPPKQYVGGSIKALNSWGNYQGNSITFMNSAIETVPSVIPTSITDASSMFYGCAGFDGTSIKWLDVTNIINMEYMFFDCSNLSVDSLVWNVSNVENMDFMFSNSSFNGAISQWNVESVTSMTGMFSAATSFNQDISGWDVSNVTNMDAMFNNAQSFNQDLSDWCVEQFIEEPTAFADNTPNWALPKPNWGEACGEEILPVDPPEEGTE